MIGYRWIHRLGRPREQTDSNMRDRSGSTDIRILSGARVAALLVSAAVIAACSSLPRSANVTIISPDERHVLHYDASHELVEATLPADFPPKEVNVDDFVASLSPIVSYREFGLGVGNNFATEDEAAESIKAWMRDNAFLTESVPSPYLIAVMNLIIYPPAQFKKSEHLRSLEADSRELYFSLNQQRYVQLVREWLAYNRESKPRWLEFTE